MYCFADHPPQCSLRGASLCFQKKNNKESNAISLPGPLRGLIITLMSPFSVTEQVVGSKPGFLSHRDHRSSPHLPPSPQPPRGGPILPAAAAPAASEGPRGGETPDGSAKPFFLGGELLNSPQPRLFNQLLANRDVCASGRVILIIWELFCSRCRPGPSAALLLQVGKPAPPREKKRGKREERRSQTFFP